MKKHLFLILVLILGFFWWGNSAIAQEDSSSVNCATQDGDIAAYQLSYDQCMSTCNAGLPPLSLRDPDQEYPDCESDCIQYYESLQSHKAMYSNCVTEWKISCSDNKANAHVTAIGACVCDDGYKDVDGTCKPCSDEWVCCGISLNTSVPFIGKCIESEKDYTSPGETWVTWEEAFPVLMWSLTKMLVTVILIVSFVLILIGGIMITTGNPSGGKKMIIKVVIGIAMLWASGVILRLINPNFFG